jgi:phospholipid-binding lipoprotein MlaA
VSASVSVLALLLAGAPLASPVDAAPAVEMPAATSSTPTPVIPETVTAPVVAPEQPPAPIPVPDQPAAASDEIIVNAIDRTPPGDPLGVVNQQSFEVTQTLDKALVAPVASAYRSVIPTPVRSGLRNFFNNLAEPVAFLNYLLQIKPGKAVETLGRFAINSTVGAAGLVDVAKKRPFNLPRRRNGFANTLGYYGVKPGPFLYLPLIGPTTVRDLVGLGLDRLVVPAAVGKPFNQPTYAIPASIIGSIDYRVEYDAELQKIRDDKNPYAASRARYLNSRQAEIDALKAKPVKEMKKID